MTEDEEFEALEQRLNMKEQEYEQVNHPNGVTTWKTKPKVKPEALRWLNNSTVNGPMLAFASPPKPVGWWVLYAQGPQRTVFAMYHKPTDEQIKNTEQLLGWTWRDEL